MKNLKKIMMVLGMSAMTMGMFAGCGNQAEPAQTEEAAVETEAEAEATELVTYEFQTYDNLNVVIDEASIVNQETSENPEESELVSAEAAGNVIAPGRDLVYLEDDNYYYVADYSRNLITVADKTKVTVTTLEAPATDDIVLSTADFNISYADGTFEAFDNYEAKNMVTVSYCKEGVEAAGSNCIIITKEEGATVDQIMDEIVKGREASASDVTDSVIGAQELAAKCFTSTSVSEESGLTVADTIQAVQSGDNVILIELIRTVGTDDEIEMEIDGAFTHTFESFSLNQ